MAGRTLIIGADSLIGGALLQRLRSQGGDVVGTTRRRTGPVDGNIAFDLARAEEMLALLPPCETVVLCAAVNGFAACRQAPELSWQVNVEATERIARWAIEQDAQPVLLSTSAVFNGSRPDVEAAEPTSPRNEYGRQKAEAERRVLSQGDIACVVRLTKVVSPDMPLVARWTDELSRGRPIHPFTDLPMAPIAVDWVVSILERIIEDRSEGIWQLSAASDASYAEVAHWLAERLGVADSLVQPHTAAGQGIPLEEIPQHSTLDCARLHKQWGIEAPAARATMEAIFPSCASLQSPPG